MLEPITESHPSDSGKRNAEPMASPASLPDLLLVERARSRDPRAFEALMRRYNQRLYRIARSIVSDEPAAESVVQEAYLLAFTDLERYEPTGKFGAWLARLAFNQALAVRRSARPRPMSPVKDTDIPVEAGEAVGPDDHLDVSHTRQILEQAIDELPEVFRTVFVLRAVEGISGIETAACLGINETTVRTRLYRAQHRMRADVASQVAGARDCIFELTGSRSDRIADKVLSRLNGTGSVEP
jgi:RNA polymerase sigma-70 factor, ECF subfamily